LKSYLKLCRYIQDHELSKDKAEDKNSFKLAAAIKLKDIIREYTRGQLPAWATVDWVKFSENFPGIKDKPLWEIYQEAKRYVNNSPQLQPPSRENWYYQAASGLKRTISKNPQAVIAGMCIGGGITGYTIGAGYASSATTSGATLICGFSANVFISLCTIAGAGLVLLAAVYLTNRYRTGRSGFFSPAIPPSDSPNRESLATIRVG
jgi:hypothetical protein